MTHRILIADDDSSFRALCVRLLRKKKTSQDWSLAEAADGEAAIDAFRNEYFDCVLIDYRLPDMLGTELVQRLCLKSKRKVPMILLSAEDLESTVGGAALLGASSFLSKDRVSGDGLANAIGNVLPNPQYGRQNGDRCVVGS